MECEKEKHFFKTKGKNPQLSQERQNPYAEVAKIYSGHEITKKENEICISFSITLYTVEVLANSARQVLT